MNNRIQIDDAILTALMERLKSSRQLLLAKQTGIPQASFSRWLSKKTCTIGQSHWERLYPMIKEFLPAGYSPGYIKTSYRDIQSGSDDLLIPALLDIFAGLTKKQKLEALLMLENLKGCSHDKTKTEESEAATE